MNKKTCAVIAVILVIGLAVGIGCWYAARRGDSQEALEREFEQMEPRESSLGDFKDMDKSFVFPKGRAKKSPKAAKDKPAKAEDDDDGRESDDPEEKLVNAFDDLTDKWTDEGGGKNPTLKDVDAFVAQFRQVPEERKDECIHRALNLIPDENVMLLAGVLMDRTQPDEIVDAIFSDILNRDEDVKLPVMRQVLKDPKHPCWEDAAWIVDVTQDAETADEGSKD